MEMFGAGSDVDKINAYVKRKGPGIDGALIYKPIL